MTTKLKKWIIKPELVFVFLAVFFGIISVFLMPILETPDENQHFQVEYAIFSSNKEAPKDIVLSEAIVLSAVRDGTYDEYYSEISNAENDGVAVNTNSQVFGGTRASVFDIMRLPQAIGILIARQIYPSLGFMVILGRLFSLAVYISILYLIIKKVRYGKWVFVLIACLPIAIQQAASLSYDSINMLAIFAWVAYIINLASQKTKLSKKQAFTGFILIIFLLLTKVNNLALLALLIAVPKNLITDTKIYQNIRANKFWILIKYSALFSIGVTVCAALYLMSERLLAGQAFHPSKLISVFINTFIWGDTGLVDITTIGLIGAFSNFYYHLPIWVTAIAFVVLALLMLSEKLPNISKRFAYVSGFLFLGLILLISTAMYYGWAMLPVRLGPNATVADGIQGRYFMPFLILLFPVFAYLQRYVKVVINNQVTLAVLVTSTSIFLLSYYVLLTWHFFWA